VTIKNRKVAAMLIMIMGFFVILWSTILIYFGFTNLRGMLGGAIWFFYILPFIFVLSPHNKDYAKVLWSIAATFIGIVAVNYLHSYFNIHYFNFHLLILAYVIFVPFSFIFLGCYCSIQSFLLPVTSKEIENDENMEKFRYFMGYYFLMITVTMGLTVPLLMYFGSYKNVNSIAFEISSFVFALGMLSVLFESRKISKETVNYFAKPIRRLNMNVKKVRKIIIIGTLLFIICSAIDELKSRQHWLIWFGSIAILLTNVSLLCKFGQIIFLPINNKKERPDNFYLPLMKNKIIIVAVLSMIFFLVFVFMAPVNQ
jgi:hypothetical protein